MASPFLIWPQVVARSVEGQWSATRIDSQVVSGIWIWTRSLSRRVCWGHRAADRQRRAG